MIIEKRLIIKKVIRYTIILIVTEIYLLLFSVTTSPLTGNFYGYDSAFFILVGKGMKHGLLPYRDFYDMKGPWLFIIEWIFQVIAEGKIGAFILQSINLSSAMFFFDKTISIGSKHRSIMELLYLIPIYLSMIFSAGGGGLTEELSLLPLSICLYFGTKFFYDACNNKEEIGNVKEDGFKYDRFESINFGLYGFFFGFLSLIRINNASLILVLVLSCIMELLIARKWKVIFRNIVLFFIGLIIAIAPILIIFKDIIHDMIFQVFVYGFKYSEQVSTIDSIQRLIEGNYKGALYPVFFFIIISIVLLKYKNWQYILFMLFVSAVSIMSIIISGRNFEHYYVLLIPTIVVGLWMTRNLIDCQGKSIIRNIIKIVIIVFLAISYKEVYNYDKAYYSNSVINERDMSYEESIIDVSNHINGDGSIYCWTPQPRWYIYAERYPCFKYCGWQNDQMSINPLIREELSDLFLNNPPSWLVLEKGDKELPDFVIKSKDLYYTIYYDNNFFVLYNKSDLKN